MRKMLLITIAIILPISFCCMAAEKKPLAQVNIKDFVGDTQVFLTGAGDHHVGFAWWIPQEYWASVFARDKTTSEHDKREMLRVLSGVSLLVVGQADISNLGAFRFYGREEIAGRMQISLIDVAKTKRALAPMETIDADLEMLLGMLRPMLAAAMGNMGNNMHFFVFNDRAGASGRLLDPYGEGCLDIRLTTRTGAAVTGSIDLPLNCLYVPRKCPNGKDAHISWKYCPWTGQKLPD